MNARTTAARRGHGAATRRPLGPTPAIPRRVSGPVARPAPRPAPAALPARRVAARPSGVAARPSVIARIAALPDHRVLDRLLRGRLWIWFIGLALGGIVAMQVSLLKLNTGISRAVQTSATLETQNASLQAGIARLSSHERIQREVTALGMGIPEAGDLEHVRVRGARDGRRAAERMTAPTDEARLALAAAGASGAQSAPGAASAGGGAVGTVPAASAPGAATGATSASAPAAPAATAPAPAPSAPAAPATAAVPATPVAATGVAGTPQG